MWPAVWREGRLILPAGQAFFAPSGVCGRANCWNRADRPRKPLSSGPGAVFFSAAGRSVQPLSFSLSVDRDHAHSGGARNRRIAARMARTIGPVTATFAPYGRPHGECRHKTGKVEINREIRAFLSAYAVKWSFFEMYQNFFWQCQRCSARLSASNDKKRQDRNKEG